MHDTIIVLDYGSQYTQLITRRVREANVYCELFSWRAPAADVMALRPKGFILSGGPNSVYDPGAPHMAATVALGVPLVSLAAQFPLWLARQFWGWRLARDVNTPLRLGEGGRRPGEGAKDSIVSNDETGADRKLAIRDLMLATLVVAVSLALARLAPADGQDVWPVWAFCCVFATVISSLTLLPAGAWLMRPPLVSSSVSLWERVAEGRVRALRRGLAWSILYAAAWIALVWIIATVQWWFALPRAPRAIDVGISSLMFTFASTLILTALLARSRGYRLAGRRKRPAHER